MPEFALANLATEDGERAALVAGGRVYRLDRLGAGFPACGLRALMDDWDAVLARCAALADDPAANALVEHPRYEAPIRFPNKLVCVGAVYSDHLQQFGLPAERWPNMPMFLRPPSTSIVGPGRTVRIPAMTRQFDWEIELCAVIGKPIKNADDETARGAIAGYTVGIDFSCRDLLDRGSAIGVDLVRAKAQDTMAPMGPVLAPARFVGDPQNLTLRLWVNGALKQDGHTGSMLFSVAEQIATISRYMALEPGDIVMTGSPAGSAREGEPFLKPGDHIRAEIEKVGRLDLELMADAGGRHAKA